MTKNRRNYYRILQVQPEAAPQVIKASYRALMGTARLHPDLGGDHEAAALINEAYAVLSDPARRQAYDRTLVSPHRPRQAAPRGAVPAGGQPAHDATSRRDPDPARWAIERRCPMCARALPAVIRPDTRCDRCDSPLAVPPQPDSRNRELLGRRSGARRAQTHSALVYSDWQGPGIAARLRDLSLTGFSILARTALPVGRPIRIVTPTLEAVGVVVACRASGALHTVHAQLLTAHLTASTGVFVRATA